MRKLFHRRRRPLLCASVGRRTICEINQAPHKEWPIVEFSQLSPVLQLLDADGKAYCHDLTSIVQEGIRWGYFSITIGKGLTCQADAILMKKEGDAPEAFAAGRADGLRLQPFYLPGCHSRPSELVGRGLFFRGLHYSGTVTPGNVSLSCICDVCDAAFGCNRSTQASVDRHIFIAATDRIRLRSARHTEGAPPASGKADPESLAALETRLPACSHCGGTFAYLNSFRCPHCAAPYIDFGRFPSEREIEYYGNYLYGEELQRFRP